ncbi:MAG: hypothetical protein GXY79_03945 [Chloroflexi bacterium]|nr:hypothetical protein [Chloroflexota bacterium]
MNTALACEGPVLLMEHGMLYDQSGPVPTDLDYQVPYGSAQVVRQGSQLTVLTYLTGVQACLERAEAWAQEGIEIEVIDLRTLDYLGMDYATIGASLARTGAALIVEQAGRSQGIGARLADEIQSRWFDLLDAPVAHLAARDVPPPVSRVLEAAVLPDGDRIHEAMGRAARRQVR